MRSLFVALRVAPEHRAAFLATLDSHIGEILAEEEGLKEFNVLTDARDPSIIYLYELWKSEAAIAHHRGGAVQQRYFSRVAGWMERRGATEGDVAQRLK